MPSPITSLVTIRFDWVRSAGLERLLGAIADNRNPSVSGILILPATRFNTSDSTFIEIAFSSPALELEGTIHVPKSEIIAIVKTDMPDDLCKVGYRGRAVSEEAERKSMFDRQPANLSA